MSRIKKKITPQKDHPPEELEDRNPPKNKNTYQEDVAMWQQDAEDARAILEYERTREILPSIN